MELCITSESGETRHVTPSTGIGRARRIDQLAASCGRLALLMEGRVYVYSLGKDDNIISEQNGVFKILKTYLENPHLDHINYPYLFHLKRVQVGIL